MWIKWRVLQLFRMVQEITENLLGGFGQINDLFGQYFKRFALAVERYYTRNLKGQRKKSLLENYYSAKFYF